MYLSKIIRSRPIIYGTACALVGYQFGVKNERESARRIIPNGWPSTCSIEYVQTTNRVHMEEVNTLTKMQQKLPNMVKKIVGEKNVVTNKMVKGARIGKGIAYCIVQPNTLLEAVEVLQACADANVAVIPTGKNTSLTGGSVPRNEDSTRPTVMVNMCNLKKIQVI